MKNILLITLALLLNVPIAEAQIKKGKDDASAKETPKKPVQEAVKVKETPQEATPTASVPTADATNPKPKDAPKATTQNNAPHNTLENEPMLNGIPTKWQNESAVILDQVLTFAYYTSRVTMLKQNAVGSMTREILSRRIKLMDKSAVTDFSEFYFSESKDDEKLRASNLKKGLDNDHIKFTVIKPSGERIKVNLADAVEVNKDVPRFYRSVYMGNNKYKKIAIPNLSVGDVLDYQISVEYDSGQSASFPFISTTLANKYAILKQEINISLEKGFYLNMNNYHGAPDFQRLDYGYDKTGKKTDKMRTFQLLDVNRDRLPDEMMSLPRTEFPSIKVQVTITHDISPFFFVEINEASQLYGEPNSVKKRLEKENVVAYFNKNYKKFRQDHNVTLPSYTLEKWMKDNKLFSKSIEEQTKAIYGFFKYQMTYKRFEDLTGVELYEKANDFGVNDFYFAAQMSKYLDATDLKYEIVCVVFRSAGKIDDFLLLSESLWVVKVEGTGGKPIYLYPMDGYQTSDFNRYLYVYGGEGYAFKSARSRSDRDEAVATVKQVTVPMPDPSVNSYVAKATAAFDDQLETLSMERTVHLTGSLKSNYTHIALLGYDFLDEYYKAYEPDYDAEDDKKERQKEEERKKKKKTKEDLKAEEDLRTMLAKRKELMAIELKDDYDDIQSYDDCQLINSGVLESKPTLTYKETFKLKNLISKAGRNYTLEIGKLMSKQPKIDDDDLKPRQSAVQMATTKMSENTIELTLPTGYTIEDMSDLNLKIDNDLMSFEVISTLVGDKLTVKTAKKYKKITAPKAEFQKIVEVFTKVYDFSQKKVVLKKQ